MGQQDERENEPNMGERKLNNEPLTWKLMRQWLIKHDLDRPKFAMMRRYVWKRIAHQVRVR